MQDLRTDFCWVRNYRIDDHVEMALSQGLLVRVNDMTSELKASGQALPGGFRWGAVKAGIKASGKLDVAVAVADKVATAAAMFTKNQVVAAPVTVGRKHLLSTGGRVSTVLVNAGNANCATG